MKVGIRMGQNLIMVFYHEHSGLKDIYEGLGEVTKSLTTMCKHLSIQLSENEGDIIKYCERIKNQEYSSDVDIVFILGGDGTVNELVNVLANDLNVPIGIIPGGTFNDFTKTLNLNLTLVKLVNNLKRLTWNHMML